MELDDYLTSVRLQSTQTHSEHQMKCGIEFRPNAKDTFCMVQLHTNMQTDSNSHWVTTGKPTQSKY